MTFPVLSAGTSAYNLTNSLRFRSSATAYLNRTFTTGSATQWTWSSWVKRGSLGPQAFIFAPNNTAGEGMYFNSSNQFAIAINGSFFLVSTAVYRDPSAWYHVVVASDMGNATPALRCRVYINGVEITAWATDARASYSSWVSWNSGVNHNIGVSNANTIYWDGYLTEINFVGGQTLTPSSFGSTNAVTGVWQPAKYTGTYGTNGFYLPFTNLTSTSTLGNDFSGNSNNWTTNNISLTAGVTYDSMTDVPTLTSPTAANFATLNPLVPPELSTTFNDGNLRFVGAGAVVGSMGMGAKTYVEMTPASVISVSIGVGPMVSGSRGAAGQGIQDSIVWFPTGSVFKDGGAVAVATYATFTSGDVCAFTFDPSNRQVSFYKNNTLQGSQTVSGTQAITFYGLGNTSASANVNFGQRPFAYTPPSGFVALNTFNLPSSTIPAGNKFMGATLYTGTSATQTITNSGGMQPDLVWTKARSNLSNQAWFDSVRGGSKVLFSDLADAEYTGTYISSFNSNGFTIGATPSSALNLSGYTYVAWQWKANGAGVTNTAGSITSTVSANTTSGFSVVTYTGTGANATVGHGLGIAPWMVIVKRRDSTGNWPVFHRNAGSDAVGFLNSSVAFSSPEPTYWNTTSPSSTVFSIGTNSAVNASGGTYVAYVFSETAGFSSIGRYTGNGSADGPFVYTGFRPRFILIKERDADRNWQLIDSARLGYNGATNPLSPNTAGAEPGAAERVDFLSNGFKPRTSAADFNISSGAYMYIAFAENPFKNALAR